MVGTRTSPSSRTAWRRGYSGWARAGPYGRWSPASASAAPLPLSSRIPWSALSTLSRCSVVGVLCCTARMVVGQDGLPSDEMEKDAPKKAKGAAHVFQALQYLRRLCRHAGCETNKQTNKRADMQTRTRTRNSALETSRSRCVALLPFAPSSCPLFACLLILLILFVWLFCIRSFVCLFVHLFVCLQPPEARARAVAPGVRERDGAAARGLDDAARRGRVAEACRAEASAAGAAP